MELHFVGRPRARDEQVARADPPRDPFSTHVPFLKFRHAPQVARNVCLRRGGHEKTIHHARKPPSTRIKHRPLERNAIGHHFTGEIPGKALVESAFELVTTFKNVDGYRGKTPAQDEHSGYIGVQAHTGLVKFRNIRIKT